MTTHLYASQTMTECGEIATLPEIETSNVLAHVTCPDCLPTEPPPALVAAWHD